MTQVVSEGIQIEAESHGNGDAPALVLIRGLGTQLVQWPASLLEGLVAEVIDANPKAAESVRAGDDKQINFLMGQVMKKTQGKANPGQVRGLLTEKLRG